jgi:hypothetical protein
MNSKGGAWTLCVPPSNVSRLGAEATMSGGSTAWRTSIVLPAVPTLKLYWPGATSPGTNVNSLEPTPAPSARARPISAAALTAVRC